jgi:hypothetical protein
MNTLPPEERQGRGTICLPETNRINDERLHTKTKEFVVYYESMKRKLKIKPI